MPTKRLSLRLLLAAAVLVSSPLAASAVERLISVNGDATVAVAPDAAMIRLGVNSQAKTAREASEANGRQMTAVLAAIRDAGISNRDIQTSRLSVQPQYEPNKAGTARLLGFQVTNQVTIRVREIDKLPGILDRGIAAGANEMSGIEFVVSEQSKLLDQARDDAVADARRKAELYAKAAGVKLGAVVAIAEEGSNPPSRPVMQAMRSAAMPVAPGEQMLRASVSVTFELTP